MGLLCTKLLYSPISRLLYLAISFSWEFDFSGFSPSFALSALHRTTISSSTCLKSSIVTSSGVAVGLGVGVAVGLGVGVAVGLGVIGPTVGVAVGLGVAVGVGLGFLVAFGVLVGLGVAFGVGLGVGDSVGISVGIADKSGTSVLAGLGQGSKISVGSGLSSGPLLGSVLSSGGLLVGSWLGTDGEPTLILQPASSMFTTISIASKNLSFFIIV